MSNSTAPLILCVGGEHVALQVRSLLLSGAGYRVLAAKNGEEALRIFRLNPVDLVIIDLWQPEGTGSEMLGEMKRIHPKVPVILLTELMDLPLGSEQADLLLTKCMTPPEFLEAISRTVAKSRTQGAEAAR